MRVSLVRTPFYSLQGASSAQDIPLSLAYLAAVLEEEGHKVSIIDGDAHDKKNGFLDITRKVVLPNLGIDLFVNNEYENAMNNASHNIWKSFFLKIKKTRPDIVGFTTYTANITSIGFLTKIIKNNLEIPIVLGGVHATALPERTIHETGADIVVVGEGEKTIVELVSSLEKNYPLEKVKGIVYKNVDKIVRTPPQTPIQDLDSIPFPALHLFNRSKYSNRAWGHIISGRGCPFNCIFCASKVMWQRTTRYRSPENVVQEMTTLYNKYGVRRFRFNDDTFTLNKKRVKKICDLIKESKLDITYMCDARVDSIDKEVLLCLKNSGCDKIAFGIESGNEQILKKIQKGISRNQALTAVSLAKKIGFIVHCFFMIGHPNETKDTILDTVNFMKLLNPDIAELNIVTPYPGTELWDIFNQKEQILNYSWHNFFHQSQGVISTDTLTRDELVDEYKRYEKVFTRHTFLKMISHWNYIINYLKYEV